MSNQKIKQKFNYSNIQNHRVCRNKLMKDIQDIYTENDKILLREVKEDLPVRKWKYIILSWIGCLNIVKMIPPLMNE